MAFGAIAQLGERYNGIVEVGGSIPPSSTNNSLKRLDFSGLFFFWISVWEKIGKKLGKKLGRFQCW